MVLGDHGKDGFGCGGTASTPSLQLGPWAQGNDALGERMRSACQLWCLAEAKECGKRNGPENSSSPARQPTPSLPDEAPQPARQMVLGGNPHGFAVLNHLAQLVQRQVLELPDALAGHPKFLANFL